MFLINYEDFIFDLSKNLMLLSNFLNISNEFSQEKIKESSVNRWKKDLTSEQVENIRRIINSNG